MKEMIQAAIPPARQMCTVCQRPVSACLCGCVQSQACTTELLILQHPLEVLQAKGSARLLHLCLQNSQLLSGECFDPQQLGQAVFSGPEPVRQPVLLYPSTEHSQAADLSRVAPPPFQPQPGQPLRLILLDATWRKSRKMLYSNPLLQQLPRLSLDSSIVSAYRIRKAERAGQLSSMEAAAYALMQLEPGNPAGAGLLASFAAFIELQSGLQRQHGKRPD